MAAGMEFEGKNIDQAIQRALDKFKIEKKQLKYDVISYGSTGIFGLVGAKKARIRVLQPKESSSKRLVETETKDLIEELMIEGFEDSALLSDHDSPVSETEDPSDQESLTAEDLKPVEIGKQVLQKILDLITDGAAIKFSRDKTHIRYEIEGGNPSIVIGKRGQTIEAIQYIVEKIVNKQIDSQRLRIEIDIEGYMENRRNHLRQLGQKMSEKAKRSGKPVTISQLNAHDRRIVHLTLKNDSGVRTQSVGDGYYRKLIIFPKKGKGKSKKKKPLNDA